jgi:signal transduction histidine kinase/DNA-binding response OmpR family regulator
MQMPVTKILLIEDDEEDFILLKKHLTRIANARYELLWQPLYEQGLEQLLTGHYDLCFLDYRLGEHNGIELIAEARQRGCKLPIVLLTGADGSELDIQALQAGADDYINKGQLQGALLHRVIRYAIERRKAELERERLLREQVMITERYEAEQERAHLLEALAFERARFEEVLSRLPSGVIMAEAPSGKIVLGNQQAETILRHPVYYSPNIEAYTEWVGWHMDGRPVEPDEWPLARAIRGESWSEDFKYQCGDNTISFIRIHGAPIRNRAGQVVAGVISFNDITEQKELERQQEVFISMATHELKTPLTALQGNVQLAQRRLQRALAEPDALSPDLKKLLEEVLLMLNRGEQQLRIQNRLINDLLDTSRIQTDAFELQRGRHNLVKLVEETVHDFQAGQPQRKLVLERLATDTMPVEIDPDRIRQVLSNYLANALKYSPAATPIHVGFSCNEHQARVWVQDSGPGLSAEAQRHIWQRFYQVPDIQVQNGSHISLGLGLYICQKLISKHGGQVGVESEQGHGSTFWFTLPLAKSDTEGPSPIEGTQE